MTRLRKKNVFRFVRNCSQNNKGWREFPDRTITQKSWDDILAILKKARYVRISVYQRLNNCKRKLSRQRWEALFKSLQFPHLVKEAFNRVTDPQIQEFPICAEITRLSNPYCTRGKTTTGTQQCLCEVFFCSKDWGQPERQGSLGDGRGPLKGRHGMKLNK